MWFEAQVREYRPDDLSTIHQEVRDASPGTVPCTPPLATAARAYLPTPISTQQQSQPQEERSPLPLEEFNISEAANNDDFSDGLIMGAPSLIQPPTPLQPLQPLSRGSYSPLGQGGDYEMGPHIHDEYLGVSPPPPSGGRAATDAEAIARLFDGIDDVSSWEPTPSIHSLSRNDRPSPTFNSEYGLWYNGSQSRERHEGVDDTLYRRFGEVQASRVREEEVEYGWELLEGFIRKSTFLSPVQLGRRIDRLVNSFPFSLCVVPSE